MPAWSMLGRERRTGAWSRGGARGRRGGRASRGGAGTSPDSLESVAADGGADRRGDEGVTGGMTGTNGAAARGVAGTTGATTVLWCEARDRAANAPARASIAMALAITRPRHGERGRCSTDCSSGADRSSGIGRPTGGLDGAALVGRPNNAPPSSPDAAPPESSRICVLATTAAAVPRPACERGR